MTINPLVIRDQAVYFDGYDLQNRTKTVGINYASGIADATTLGNTSVLNLPTIKKITAAVDGFASFDTTDLALFNAISQYDKAMTFSAKDDTDGSPSYFFNSAVADLKLGGKVGDVFPFAISADSSHDPLIQATIMMQSRAAALTTTTAGTGRQLGAVAAGKKLYCCLHGWQVGTGSLTLTIESDSTNSFSGAQTVRITHTALSAIGAEIKNVAGAITDTWWRVKATISGGAPSFKIIASLGIY